MIVGAVYGHWLYSRMFLHNFGSVFQFACPPLLVAMGFPISQLEYSHPCFVIPSGMHQISQLVVSKTNTPLFMYMGQLYEH